ncbi:MAG: protein kinase [Holophagaceae bacterium]|nr:protein kinase [Holophagaceae bacterium]
MSKDPRETSLLRKAQARGLLSAEELDLDDINMEFLLRSGRISQAQLAQLEGELKQEADDPSQLPTQAEPTPDPDLVALEASFHGWDRYEVLCFIAQGGMGRVYKAQDRKLGRLVALKFVAAGSGSAPHRFAVEAQAQARVEHKAVCRIYEVGDWHGQPYIALQYIDGKPLSECFGKMGLEEKVNLMREAAEGLHAAHRLGLIHRDIKPANIMVERCADGRLQPYVMDFGLARVQETSGLTQTGMIVGTPAYMAPEQARGDQAVVDRRSDVYALGATLYEVLTGKRPFEAKSSMDVLVAILNEEPRPLRQLVPSLPVDLESITLKCLEKDPAKRYESAQAVADDLGRFLEGEPIKARQIGPLQRLQRRIRKYPIASSLISGSILLAVGLGGMGIRAAWRAREQTALAQRFGQDAEQIDAILRYGHLLPMHHLKAEKALVIERMKSITMRMDQMGSLAQGPGNTALGRGHLALGNLPEARKALERAWGDGNHSPETASALGQVLAGIYQQSLAEARKIPNPTQREKHKKALAAELRDPALRYLQAGRSHSGFGAYIEGLIALQEERFDEALVKAGEASRQIPWFYEAIALEGQIWSAQASSLAERGEYGAVVEAVRKSEAAYDRALPIARSDDSLFLGKAKSILVEVTVNGEQGRSTEVPFARGLEALREARRADPDRVETYTLEARLRWQRASDLDNSGRDGREELKASITAAEEGIRLDPKDIRNLESLSMAYWYLSQQETNRGADGEPALQKAEEAVQRGQAVDPGSSIIYRNLGVVYGIRAEGCDRKGMDPRPDLEQSVAAFRKAIELDPDYIQAHTNLANALILLAGMQSDRGDDPRNAAEQADATLAKAVELNPNLADTWDERGKVRNILANYHHQRGEDPRQDIELALKHFQAALSRNTAMPQAMVHQAEALLLNATYLREIGQAPGKPLEEAEQASRRSRKIIRDYGEIVATFADILHLKAEILAERKQPVGPLLDEAREAISIALKRDSSSPWLWERRARIELLRARLDPGTASKALQSSESFLQKAEAHSAQTTVNLNLRARLAKEQAAFASRSGTNADPVLRQGLEALDRSMTLNPNQAEARALRGALLLSRSRGQKEAKTRREDARMAHLEFEAALRANPLLRREWQAFLDEAAKISAS